MTRIWLFFQGMYLSVYEKFAPQKFENRTVKRLIKIVRSQKRLLLPRKYSQAIVPFKKRIEDAVMNGEVNIEIGKETWTNQKIALEVAQYCKDIDLKNVSVQSVSQYGKSHPCTPGMPWPWNTLYVTAEV